MISYSRTELLNDIAYIEQNAKEVQSRGFISEAWERYLSSRTRMITDHLIKLQKFANRKSGRINTTLIIFVSECRERVSNSWKIINANLDGEL